MSESSIIERIKAGDQQALTDIYNKYRTEFLQWITNHYKVSMEDAYDLYQVSVVIFYENILKEKLTNLTSSVKTYLFAIGKNKALEKIKKSRPMTSEDYLLNNIVYEEGVEEMEEKESAIIKVAEAMKELGDPCKALLELYYYGRQSMEEIAEQLKYKNADTAKNLKYKCLKRLQKLCGQP